jgi:uncharacterized protein YcgI (DUF1989 family)
VDKFTISVEDQGKGWVVKKGQTARIICIEGCQIADVCFYNANDYKEHLWNDQTLNREGVHLTTYSRLWSNMPKFRPMMTIIEDTVENKPSYPGSRHHPILGAHCNPHFWYAVLKDKNHRFVRSFNCYYNLCRAVAPFGLGPGDLHDNLNLFMKAFTDLETSQWVYEQPDVKQGDYVEFYAEMDVLMALSLCPYGSGKFLELIANQTPGPDDIRRLEEDIRPLGVEIYDTGIEPLEFEEVLGI